MSRVGAFRMCLGGVSEPVASAAAHGRAEGPVGGVRLGGEREVDHRLGQRELALGRAEALVGLPGVEAET